LKSPRRKEKSNLPQKWAQHIEKTRNETYAQAAFVGKLLKNPRDVKERAALEVFIARELYGLSLEDWKHLAGSFTFGNGPTKEELDEIIRQSMVLWTQTPA
jgi:hypothetical protein